MFLSVDLTQKEKKVRLLKSKMLLALVLLLILFTGCKQTPRVVYNPDRRLSDLVLVRQPAGTNFCGPACIAMVENYYFEESNSLEYIWDQVSHMDQFHGIMGGSVTKSGNYLNKKGLFVSVISFMDLREILVYLEKNQVPAIMGISGSFNPEMGHGVVFAGYDEENGIITVLDPMRVRSKMSFEDLLGSFTFRSDNFGNQIIIASARFNSARNFRCRSCWKRMQVEESILESIWTLACTGCDKNWAVQCVSCNENVSDFLVKQFGYGIFGLMSGTGCLNCRYKYPAVEVST